MFGKVSLKLPKARSELLNFASFIHGQCSVARAVNPPRNYRETVKLHTMNKIFELTQVNAVV